MRLPPKPSFTFLLAVSLSAGVIVAALAWLLLGVVNVARGAGVLLEALIEQVR